MKPICQNCGNEVPLPKYNRKDSYKEYLQRKFCSRACANASHIQAMRSRRTRPNSKTCMECEKTIYRETTIHKSSFDRLKYCSAACYHNHKKRTNSHANQYGPEKKRAPKCVQCGKRLNKGISYCSRACKNRALRKQVPPKKCCFCGQLYYHKSKQLHAFKKSKYCGRSCFSKAQRLAQRLEGGYWIKTIGNGTGRKRQLHRLLAERLLKRKLAPNEVVHHIDMQRTNNAAENLLVTTNSKHMWLHQEMQRRYIQERKGVLPDDLLSVGIWLGGLSPIR